MDSIRADLVVPGMPSASRPLSARIESIVAAFTEMFDKVVPLRVAAGQFVDHPALLERSQTARNELREATFEVFAPEFAALSDQEREQLADAIGSALSLDAWIVLRRRDGLSLERATAVWRLTLTALSRRPSARQRPTKLSRTPIDLAFAIRDLRAPKGIRPHRTWRPVNFMKIIRGGARQGGLRPWIWPRFSPASLPW